MKATSSGFILIVAFILTGPRTSAETANISEVNVVHFSTRATVTAGQSVILACGFSRPVNCSWERNSVDVEISNRYKYIDDANGIQTRNCWIEIKTVEERDAGHWSCGFNTKYANIVILSNPVNLTVTGKYTGTNTQNMTDHKVTFTQCPSDATVKSGQSVTLACALDHPVNCSWMRNATPVTISNRYRYADGRDGIDTSNCTLEIIDAGHSLDTGNWTCTVKTDHGKVSPESRSARLNFQLDNNDPPGSTSENAANLVHSPASAKVTAGQPVILACEFDRPVNCFWKRNTNIVTIAERYKYIDDGNGIQTRNCSIKIEMANVKDAGIWTCVIPMTSARDGMQSEPACLQVAETDSVSISEICSTEPSPLATQTADVNAAMIAVIVTQAIIIAAFLTYILWLRRAKAAKQHTYENIGPAVLYASTSQPVQNVTEVITGTRWTSTTETSQGYLMPRQIQIGQNTVYAKNSPRNHVYETIPE